MWRCPVCEKEHMQGFVCDDCGFDLSFDYEQNRTLCSALPKRMEPISVRTAKWRQQQKQRTAVSLGNLVCPKCGGKYFFFLIDELQFMCTNCEVKMPITVQKDGLVSESDSSAEKEVPEAPNNPPVSVSAEEPIQLVAEPLIEPEQDQPEPVPEPTEGIRQGDFRNTSDQLWVYFWIYLSAAAGLVLLARIIAWTYQSVLEFVPMMLLSAVFYVVSAVFVFRCCRRIRELPDARSADSLLRTTVFFGTLILIHVLLTALYQFILWFGYPLFGEVYWRNMVDFPYSPSVWYSLYTLDGPLYGLAPVLGSPIFLNFVFCVISAAFVFRRRRHIREMLDAGLTDSVRRTAVFFGMLILIRVLLSAIPYFIGWLDPASFYFFFRYLF